jgi:hypothetical protein
MDRLADLPTDENSTNTPEEENVMKKYFPSSTPPSTKWGTAFKMTGYIAVLFMALANPWIDVILSKIPYCENPIALFFVKGFIFAFIFLIIFKFVL